MKTAFAALFLALLASLSWAGDAPSIPAAQPPALQGEVQETFDAAGYTYLRLQTADGEIWAAVLQASLKPGDKVTVQQPMLMKDFTSSSLHRTFPVIYFGTLEGAGYAAPAAAPLGASHAGLANTEGAAEVQVDKADGPNAWSVAEINAKVAELKDQPVVVRGQVVKYNPNIMGKNWIHLRDGSGSEADRSNDLLVTSQGQAKVGDVVTAKGVVRADQDFGYGYTYRVLVEEATLEQ